MNRRELLALLATTPLAALLRWPRNSTVATGPVEMSISYYVDMTGRITGLHSVSPVLVTNEVIRHSTVSAEKLVRDALEES
jgi:hypothetical protein